MKDSSFRIMASDMRHDYSRYIPQISYHFAPLGGLKSHRPLIIIDVFNQLYV